MFRRAIAYKRAFKKAMTKANIKARSLKTAPLRNIWNMSGLEPTEAFCPFFIPPKRMQFNKRHRTRNVWKRYQIKQVDRWFTFTTMERSKLIFRMISRIMNLNYLKEKGLIVDFIPLHNYYELTGQKKDL